MYLETIATDSTMTSRTLGLPRETPRDKNIANIVENQEAHNALLAVLIFVALCVQDLFWLRLLLWFIILSQYSAGSQAILKLSSNKEVWLFLHSLLSFFKQDLWLRAHPKSCCRVQNVFGRARSLAAGCKTCSGAPEALLQGCKTRSGAPEALLQGCNWETDYSGHAYKMQFAAMWKLHSVI